MCVIYAVIHHTNGDASASDPALPRGNHIQIEVVLTASLAFFNRRQKRKSEQEESVKTGRLKAI